MLEKIDWMEVQPAGEGLPAGGYVLKIVKAKEETVTGWGDTVEIVYDIAEGEKKGHYASDEDWKHTTSIFITDKDGNPQRGFRSFLDNLVNDNPNFKIEGFNNAKQLEGLIFGGCIQKRHYINQKGEEKYSMDVLKRVSADDIRKGTYEMPEEKQIKKKNDNSDDVKDISEFTGDVDVAF